jgi:hypothetical protein
MLTRFYTGSGSATIRTVPGGAFLVARCHLRVPGQTYPDVDGYDPNDWWIYAEYDGTLGWVPDGRVWTRGDARNDSAIPHCEMGG